MNELKAGHKLLGRPNNGLQLTVLSVTAVAEHTARQLVSAAEAECLGASSNEGTGGYYSENISCETALLI